MQIVTQETTKKLTHVIAATRGDLAILAIRGSQTAWDWGVNMQLWSAAGLAQVVKWMLPFGWIWTPILDEVSKP